MVHLREIMKGGIQEKKSKDSFVKKNRKKSGTGDPGEFNLGGVRK